MGNGNENHQVSFQVVGLMDHFKFDRETGALTIQRHAVLVEDGMVLDAQGRAQQWAVPIGKPEHVSGTHLRTGLECLKAQAAAGKAGKITSGPERPPPPKIRSS